MRSFWRSTLKHPEHFSWRLFKDYLLIALGALLQALALRLFLIPARLASGGISGLAQIINYYMGWPVGMMILIGNIPLFFLGWRFLGGRRFAMRTAFAVLAVSFLTDFLVLFLPENGLTNDMVLNVLYGAIISGVGYGLVYRGQATSGGSDILARMLNSWRGISITQSYLLTDALIIFLAGLSFSWENALYALVMLYISGIAAETTMEGANVVRTAMIITNNPDPVVQDILESMERGVTILEGKGGYTGVERTILYCVVTRSEIAQIKALVKEADPQAFIVIGQANEVLGEGFRPLHAG
jgi:uncharacterized membrane-anchored protein YitT (DUF2179 family)